jgi:myosin heavy subunit
MILPQQRVKAPNPVHYSELTSLQAEYVEEGINLADDGGVGGGDGAAYEDNSPCVELLERRGDGVLALVDEEGRIPGGSEYQKESLLERMRG